MSMLGSNTGASNPMLKMLMTLMMQKRLGNPNTGTRIQPPRSLPIQRPLMMGPLPTTNRSMDYRGLARAMLMSNTGRKLPFQRPL